MWSKETIKNKIYALVLIGIGALSILPENDATAFIFFCLIGVPLFFAKENWIMDGGGSDYVAMILSRSSSNLIEAEHIFRGYSNLQEHLLEMGVSIIC